MKCVVCENPLSGRQTKFCSKKCHISSHSCYPLQKKRGDERKAAILKQFGGKCSKCGYCKNSAALSFHHKDPKTKKFGLDVRSLSNRKFSVIEEEIVKCELLCLNCHAEEHNPDAEIEWEVPVLPRSNPDYESGA